jgi:SecA DEAD-like domain
MIVALARKLFGSSSEPRIKRYMPRVAQINALEKDLEKLSDDALRARTEAFKKRVAVGDSNPPQAAAEMVHKDGIEPPARDSSDRRSTTELLVHVWCGRRESNPPRRSGTPRPNQ